MITNETQFQAELEHVVAEAGRLAKLVLGQELAVDTACFFSSSPEDYTLLLKKVIAAGPVSEFSHGVTTYVNVDMQVAGQHLGLLGVRQPDVLRQERGYGDYSVDFFDILLGQIDKNPYAQPITSGRGKTLIELKHPDFDVRGYVVNAHDQ